jgi:hypothetical protein
VEPYHGVSAPQSVNLSAIFTFPNSRVVFRDHGRATENLLRRSSQAAGEDSPLHTINFQLGLRRVVLIATNRMYASFQKINGSGLRLMFAYLALNKTTIVSQ